MQMRTLWRATERRHPRLGRGTWWAESRSDAEAYRDNQGYGGPCLYTLRTSSARVLDLGDLADHAAIARIAEVLGDQDMAERQQGAYAHELLDDERTARRLAGRYDWIVIADSYPEGARSWLRLSALPAAERATIRRID